MDHESAQQSTSNGTDEDDCSGGEEDHLSDVRRRRFCNERQQLTGDNAVSPQASKKMKMTSVSSKYTKQTLPTNRRRKAQIPKFRTPNRQHQHIGTSFTGDQASELSPQESRSSVQKTYRSQVDSDNNIKLSTNIPHEPVIYLNPKFIKKFIDKLIKLSAPAGDACATTTPATKPSDLSGNSQASTSASESGVAEDQQLETTSLGACPKSALQAASTMAVIRLVTECIEDDSKRDEKLNKTLTNRLIEVLTRSRPESSSGTLDDNRDDYVGTRNQACKESGSTG